MLNLTLLELIKADISTETLDDPMSLSKAKAETNRMMRTAYKAVKYFAEKDYLTHHKYKDKESRKNVYTNFNENNIKTILSKFKACAEASAAVRGKADVNGIDKLVRCAFQLVQYCQGSHRDTSPMAKALTGSMTYIKSADRKIVDGNIYNLLKYIRHSIAIVNKELSKYTKTRGSKENLDISVESLSSSASNRAAIKSKIIEVYDRISKAYTLFRNTVLEDRDNNLPKSNKQSCNSVFTYNNKTAITKVLREMSKAVSAVKKMDNAKDIEFLTKTADVVTKVVTRVANSSPKQEVLPRTEHKHDLYSLANYFREIKRYTKNVLFNKYTKANKTR